MTRRRNATIVFGLLLQWPTPDAVFQEADGDEERQSLTGSVVLAVEAAGIEPASKKRKHPKPKASGS